MLTSNHILLLQDGPIEHRSCPSSGQIVADQTQISVAKHRISFAFQMENDSEMLTPIRQAPGAGK